MGLEINIEHNFHDIKKMMDEISKVEILAATKKAMNVALTRGRVVVVKEIRKHVNLAPAKVKKRIQIKRASGESLNAVVGALAFSDIPIAMKEFVVGKKEDIKQKGIPVKKRRKLKVKIKPGKTVRLKGAFIQTMKSQQVFRRRGDGPQSRKLGTKSIGTIAFQRNVRPRIEETILKRFDREFNRQIRFRFGKIAKKYSKSPMRLPR